MSVCASIDIHVNPWRRRETQTRQTDIQASSPTSRHSLLSGRWGAARRSTAQAAPCVLRTEHVLGLGISKTDPGTCKSIDWTAFVGACRPVRPSVRPSIGRPPRGYVAWVDAPSCLAYFRQTLHPFCCCHLTALNIHSIHRRGRARGGKGGLGWLRTPAAALPAASGTQSRIASRRRLLLDGRLRLTAPATPSTTPGSTLA